MTKPKREKCPVCYGTGKLRIIFYDWGDYDDMDLCPDCHGKGFIEKATPEKHPDDCGCVLCGYADILRQLEPKPKSKDPAPQTAPKDPTVTEKGSICRDMPDTPEGALRLLKREKPDIGADEMYPCVSCAVKPSRCAWKKRPRLVYAKSKPTCWKPKTPRKKAHK